MSKKMPLHLCYGLQTHHLLLSGAQEESLPHGVGKACFPGLISHLKREFSGRLFCKEPAYTILFQELWFLQSFATMVQYSVYLKHPFLLYAVDRTAEMQPWFGWMDSTARFPESVFDPFLFKSACNHEWSNWNRRRLLQTKEQFNGIKAMSHLGCCD